VRDDHPRGARRARARPPGERHALKEGAIPSVKAVARWSVSERRWRAYPCRDTPRHDCAHPTISPSLELFVGSPPIFCTPKPSSWPADSLPELYASCDAFLFSSTTETLGLVVLEAMASGLPVIATPVGGVADHLRDEENGLAFPPHDSDAMAAQMVRLAQSTELATRLGTNARETAESLSWELEYDRLDYSYRDLLQQLRARTAINANQSKAPLVTA
jgi:glycosyltransferase involved in cell wall biosynthesis